jgi:pimeloyl-ACP methyl ester carboxylesterase
VTPLYLHGFASSSNSTKAAYFAERLAQHDVALRCPDFNQPEFATLTMTRMLAQLEAELASIGSGPSAIIGSSLGGTLAILAAARFPASIDRLVLLAPAVMFAKPGHHLLPPERTEEWRRRGALPFFHYGAQAERTLNVGFFEDSLRYNPFETAFPQPTLIFQGLRDQSVDYHTVEQFARARPNVVVTLLDDDHQLMASLPRIWNDIEPFLGLIE